MGASIIIITKAASPSVVIEPESASLTSPAVTGADVNASGNSYVQFKSAGTPPVTGAMPTKDNTGPRYAMTNITPDQFFSSRTCNRQKINGDVIFNQSYMMGQTFNLTDCEITGKMDIYLASGRALTLAEMPIINMDYVDLNGGLNTHNAAKLTFNHSLSGVGSQITLKDYWSPFISAPAPMTFTNSMFYQVLGYYNSPADYEHTTTLHGADYGIGYTFTNVTFQHQRCPSIDICGVTAVVEFSGDAVFEGCYFIYDGPGTATWNTFYMRGGNQTIKNSFMQRSLGDYVSFEHPNPVFTFTNNVDYDTRQPIQPN